MKIDHSLGPVEQQLLELVWKHPESTCRTIHSLVNQTHRCAYTTIMTILNRLVEKQIITRDKSGKAYTYSPVQTQSQFIQQTVQNAIRSVVNRFGDEAIAAFITESHKLTATDRKQIQKKLKKSITR